MHTAYIIDIETIPSDQAKEALEPFIGDLRGRVKRGSEEDKYEIALSKAALSPVSGRVIWIGVKMLELEGDGIWQEKGLYHFCKDDERETLKQFFHFCSGHGLTAGNVARDREWVTFNGRSFDFPFLMYRAASHLIPLTLPIYKYNSNDGHFDLFQHLNTISCLDHLDSSLQMVGLKKWATHFNLGHKLEIKSGEINLQELWKNGNKKEIEQYVNTDLDITEGLMVMFYSPWRAK